jgi:hypothetical protein
MSDSELAVVSADSFATPTLITRAGLSTRKKFFEFFTVPIRNAHTRAAYYRAIQQFLAWSERAGYQDLEDIEPITVAAYIETLQRLAAPPTVKPKSGCDGADFAKDVGSHLPALERAGKIIFSVWSSRLWIDLNRSVLQGHLPGSSNCRCKRFRARNGAIGTNNHN